MTRVSNRCAEDKTERDSPVLTERHGHVLIITINRPEARNAINKAVAAGIGRALESAEAELAIRAIVLTGSGDNAFCAGADLKALARGDEITFPENSPEAQWGFAGYVRHAVSVPTICAVNGAALGGGTELALASDLVVAAETATFGLPEVKRGIIAAAGGAFRLSTQIPPKLALELALTGDSITASRAHELGLVNHVVPGDKLLATALDLADRISANAPLAVQSTKRIARGIIGSIYDGESKHWNLSNREALNIMGSSDAAEGVRAFAEKRLPRWEGR